MAITGLLVAVLTVAGFLASVGARGAALILTVPNIGPAQVVDQNDVADPSVLTVGATYYLFGTTDWRSNVPTATSTDLVHWQDLPDSFPQLPSWATPSISMTWAPSVIGIGGRYVMYVTTEERTSGLQCIAVAVASRPAGPYLDRSLAPLMCQRSQGGSIDPDVVRDPAGGLHLAWKSNGNCCGLPTYLWEQDLSPDGLHLLGAAHRLLAADQPWQDGNIEGPDLVAAPRGWWLFYSGGNWRSSSYATGIAWCPALDGPCRDALDVALLPSTTAMRTPSGLSTFADARGRTWAAFTTTVLVPSPWRPGRTYENRVLDVAPVVG
jgi:beta-xylosidase